MFNFVNFKCVCVFPPPDACASLSVYLGQQKEQEEYSLFTIQDPRETFGTIQHVRAVLEELQAHHDTHGALADEPGSM